MPLFKEWLFYITIAWNPPAMPLLEEYKTLVLQFDVKRECESIAKQVKDQIETTNNQIRIKQIGCYPCPSIHAKDRCLAKKGK